MTDSRLPARWLIDPVMDGLSDRAWRTFTGSLMWSNEAGTDGAIPRNALRFLHPAGTDGATTHELIEAGLWSADGNGVRVVDWTGLGQSTAEAVEARKESNRTRQARKRSRDAQRAAVTNDSAHDVTRDVGQERTGQRQDRTGLSTAAQPKNADEWPVATIGRDRATPPADHQPERERNSA